MPAPEGTQLRAAAGAVAEVFGCSSRRRSEFFPSVPALAWPSNESGRGTNRGGVAVEPVKKSRLSESTGRPAAACNA